MTKNEAFRHLNIPLPSDIARRKEMGDLDGAIRLIDLRLASAPQPELALRLTAERIRLERLPYDYSLDRSQALAQLRKEWPACSDEQFDALVDHGRIDWRMVNREPHYHSRFLESLRLYPALAPGLKPESADNTYRDQTLSRMHAEGSLTARITLRTSIQACGDVSGQEVQAWLPIPSCCPQQSEIEILDFTPGGICAPEDAPQRTIWWKNHEISNFSVTYRYLHRAAYVDPLKLKADPKQPCFDLEEQAPHIIFTPYLRALATHLTEGLSDPIQKAKAIYDYITGHVDYRYQPAYIQLDPICEMCAKDLRGDCGMFALLFITLCRISGIPARWQSGLTVRPGFVGAHDWAMFYIAPHGWLWADCSFGSAARRNGESERRNHYFGNLDPWRMVSNREFQAPLTPPMSDWRNDPFDNQSGEIMVSGRGLGGNERSFTRELLEFTLL